ncbi:MAG: hypothetical protein JNK82_23955 [Myxococcaceae bacterium]|nr:hypothetical protein [Myxococcaceae bacterium]
MGRSFEVACTVRVSHRFEDLSAHVELDGGLPLYPGDQVRVHGTALRPRYGETLNARRVATVTRASWLERTWVRWVGDLDCLTLFDFGDET